MDVFDVEKRSWIMSRVKSKNTKPEIMVRSIIYHLGYRFRLHRSDLPGKPDIVLSGRRKVIFVHGCFWHGHKECKRSGRPSSNIWFWEEKLNKNIERDKQYLRQLRESGWDALIVWQCELKDVDRLIEKLQCFLNKKGVEDE
ncbi:MAG TPA: very short patch repair endonuclease [Firmicutes bacterium]|nr:very short patch repair endonuclease [Bacillota bacterium]